MQKAVLKLEFQSDKEKKKAMKIASGVRGVESIRMDMKDRKLTVAGVMDPVEVAEKLRKLFPTEIVSLGPAKEDKKKDDKKKDDDKSNKNEQSKDSKSPAEGYPFQHWYFTPPPPPQPYHYGHYPPMYDSGRNLSIEENPNACVIC